MTRVKRALMLLTTASMLAGSTVRANTNIIMVDEFGGGRSQTLGGIQVLFSTNKVDTTGGLLNWLVLTYTLPFLGTEGDVLMHEVQPGYPVLDVIRFDGQGHLIFYSDSLDGFTSLADTPGPPDPFLANLVEIQEQGYVPYVFGEYTPTIGQPGWDVSAPTYFLISEGVVPEPQIITLLMTGLGILGWRRMRQRNNAPVKSDSKTNVTRLLSLVTVVFLSINNSRAQEAAPVEVGLPLGQQAPSFTLKDQNGKDVSLNALLKKGPVAIVFYRSADWCMYCKMRLIQIQRNLGEVESAGHQVVGISYDAPESVKRFASSQQIGFSLLSDVGSKTIEAYSMLNKTAADGTANHGIIIVDQKGIVRAKLFPSSHSDREVMDQIMAAFKEAKGASGGTKS